MSSFFQARTGLALLDPALLWLALLVPLALWMRWRGGAPALRFAPGAFLMDLPRSWRARLCPLPRALHVLGLLALVLALARPVRRDPLPPVSEGIDIFLCLDVSSSMAATDMDPERSRLDVAKSSAAAFVAARPHDRIGLLTFARYPDLVSPLTLDHAALAKLLAGVERVAPEGPEDATGIGTAVACAAELLAKSDARSKLAIVLTDGEENVATVHARSEIAPLHAAQLCQQLGVRVDSIAAGIGGPDAQGEWKALDPRELQRLAARTGGAFYEARDAGALARVYADIDAMEKTELAEPRYRIEERFLPFLLAGVALVLLARLLESTALEVSP